MDRSTSLFSELLAQLRGEGHHLPLTDAAAAQLIADALDIIMPDNEPEDEAAPYFANSFAGIAASRRPVGRVSGRLRPGGLVRLRLRRRAIGGAR